MVYFRIEDVENSMGISRDYQIKEEDLPVIHKKEVEHYIAEEIRKQVNGSKNRRLLSYSKSLGVCLLKYNGYCDNELHICDDDNIGYDNLIYYDESNYGLQYEYYSLKDALYMGRLFNGEGKIKLYNFAMDVSDNNVLNQYLLKFTNIGLKKFASPEKDSEVVMMQAYNDRVVKNYLNSIYVLYGLQLKYRFLWYDNVAERVICEILQLEDFRFDNCEQEREAIVFLIRYLYDNTEQEELINKKIFEYAYKKEHLPLYYDSMLQFHGIQEDSFEDSYCLSDYNDNVVSDIFWRHCWKALKENNKI